MVQSLDGRGGKPGVVRGRPAPHTSAPPVEPLPNALCSTWVLQSEVSRVAQHFRCPLHAFRASSACEHAACEGVGGGCACTRRRRHRRRPSRTRWLKLCHCYSVAIRMLGWIMIHLGGGVEAGGGTEVRSMRECEAGGHTAGSQAFFQGRFLCGCGLWLSCEAGG